VPSTTAYQDEAALQAIVAESPALLSGVSGTPMVTVTELEVDSSRYPDVVGVSESGEITIVECKLRANPEIRRAVVGQILAYASGLWGLTYEAFDKKFSARAGDGRSLADRMLACADPDWDEEAFREAVAANLAAGRFHLVIAVDEITDELKGIVRYLNAQTGSNVQIAALELRYSADGDVEILVPAVYGQEAADQKAVAPPKHRWEEQELLEALETMCSPSARSAVSRVLEYARNHGGGFVGGTAGYPSGAARMPVHGKPTTVSNFYADPSQKSVFSLNFEYLADVFPIATMTEFAVRLRAIPELARYLNGLESVGFKKRPSIPINEVLGAPDVCDRILKALDELLMDGGADEPAAG